MKQVKGRFAPSPTGRMHLGNAFSALLSWLSARSGGGKWLLRIEDLDSSRSRDEYARLIEDDLRWLGLDWDEGGTENPEYRQSRRSGIYDGCFRRLCGTGLVYPCFCSRADLLAAGAPHQSDGRVIYGGVCRPLRLGGHAPDNYGYAPDNYGHAPDNYGHAPDKPENVPNSRGNVPDGFPLRRKPSWRICVPDENIAVDDLHYGRVEINLARDCGDFIIRRSDGTAAYQLAVVVDDALMGVTEVVRGSDLLLSSPQQKWLYGMLGFETPQFAHLPLLCSSDGRRLCKRDRDMDMEQLRMRFTPEELTGLLAKNAGLQDDDTPVRPDALLEVFNWGKVPRNDIVLQV